MRFCSITPLKNAALMYENEMVMLLAHLSKESEIYRGYARNSDKYKIMDNSIIELGSAFSMEDLMEQARECLANEIILPDSFESGTGTVRLVSQSIKWLKDHGCLGEFKLMAVCHGRGPMEFEWAFRQLDRMPEIDAIGIPKVACKWMVSRPRSAEYLARTTQKQIHLLGCWDSLAELKQIPKDTKIRSMDTCLPALLSIYGMGTFDSRQGKTIDLETAEVNETKYREIMEEIQKYLC